MKICPSCQTRHPDEAHACSECGAGLMLDPASQPDPQLGLVGRVLAGNYRVEGLLGKGGMGAVYRARQLSLDRQVAVKVLLAPLAMESEMLERFQREARSASNIGHPGIVQVIDLGYLEEGPPFIAMELLEGEDLRSKLSREGALPAAQAIPIVLQVCDALQAAHEKGIVHRDLKPDNIFLVYRHGKVPLVKLLDFGLSKIKSADRKLTNTGALLGTPNYMSPEQVKAEREVDHRTDVYAIGAILYEMLTGRSAYDGASVQSILVSIMTEDPPVPRSLRPDMPESLEAVILKAMARDPAGRHATTNALAVDLATVGGQVGVPPSHLSFVSSQSSQPAAVQPAPARPVATPPHTPPPISVPASTPGVVARPPRAGRLLLAGLLGAVALVVLAVVAGGAALVAVFLAGDRSAVDEEKSAALETIFEDVEAVLEPGQEDDDVATASNPGHRLGTGQNPHVCCGKKGCSVLYQVEVDGGTTIHFARLGDDLAPETKPGPISPEDETSLWPTCFAREDGGVLVFYQEARDPFDMSAVVRLHRLVVSAGGKAGKRMTTEIRNMVSMDEMEPGYDASSSGDRVFVAWNHHYKVESGIRFSIFDLDGKQVQSDVVVHKKPTVFSSSIACGKDRCLIAWTRPSLPMNHIRKFSIISTSGKVLEEDRDTWDRGVHVSGMTVVPVMNGVAMTWVEQDKKGRDSQMLATYGWDGKQKLEPTRLEPFGDAFGHAEHLAYVAGSTEGTIVTITRPTAAGEGEDEAALVLVIDDDGKVQARTTISVPDDEVYDASIFLDAKVNPVLVYGTGSWGSDQELHAVPIKKDD